MTTVTVSTLINRAKTTAQDIDYVQWAESEWLDWVNEGVLTVVAIRPDATAATRTLTLVAGVRQQAPEDSFKVLDVVCNTVSGRAIRAIDRAVMDDQFPNWYNVTGKEPLYYVYDNTLTPKTFYVYPAPKTADHQIDVVISVAPQTVTATSDLMPFDDWYAPAMVDYLLYRAYLKNAEFTNDLARSNHFIKMFHSRLGAGGEG